MTETGAIDGTWCDKVALWVCMAPLQCYHIYFESVIRLPTEVPVWSVEWLRRLFKPFHLPRQLPHQHRSHQDGLCTRLDYLQRILFSSCARQIIRCLPGPKKKSLGTGCVIAAKPIRPPE